jgi:hypothetical protein
MEVSTAQDAALNNVEPEQPKEGGKSFWKNLFRTVLGISISIVLTFGTTALIQRCQTAKDRKMTALMVMGNIEVFADNLERNAIRMGWNDTLATYLLSIPDDSIDLIDKDTLRFCVNNVTAYYTLSHDKSAESIFSNSIDTWKNLGNFEFIEHVGNCFASINSMEEIYNEFYSTPDRIRERMLQNLEAYPGNSPAAKMLRDREYRDHLAHIHSQAEYYRYLAAYIRYQNAKNMKLMGVTEENVRSFIEENNKKEVTGHQAPDQNAFRTPPINADNLPAFKDWIKQ